MRTLRFFLFAAWFLSAFVCPAGAADDVSVYTKQIKPLLRERCFGCHAALKQQAGLRLDTVAGMRKGGDSGAAIVSGKVQASRLVQRVAAKNPDERMPPDGEGEPLTAAQIEMIRRWIAAGAPAPDDEQPEADPADHWAFQPIARPAVPEVRNTKWVRNPIDAFLARRYEERNLKPQRDAERIVLLRRLHVGLLGLPPSTEEITRFENDQADDWYERTVRQLLNDPRHGERWARHWMDIWRYSDWWGFGQQLRNSQKHIWHWRDWIVESLNEDVPYDEMVRLMLAADELHPGDLDKLRATGFLARNYFLFNRPQWMDDSVEHVSKGLLGLTMNCTKCHDHKYDPFEQIDFYRLRAFFEPYHVRLDIVPGEADLERNGIPRVYDGLIDKPTWLYVRGDEKNPDKSRAIEPGVPKLLQFDELSVEPISLPPEAFEPERQPWVLDAHLAAARRRVEKAESELTAAKEKLAAAQQVLASAKSVTKSTGSVADSGTILVSDDFEMLNEERWKLSGGDWVHRPGEIEQQRDGKTRAALRLIGKPPRDFDATIRFTIKGGSQYRSVGLSFDSAADDPTQTSAANYYEQNVYVSGQMPGSKIHAAYNKAGQWHYPQGPAVRALPVALNREHTLRVQVRGQLINASLNGELVIACLTPVPRRDGLMQVTTFDALTVFHNIQIRSLPANVPLVTPGKTRPSPEAAGRDVDVAKASLEVAQAAVAVAQADLLSSAQRAAAMRSSWSEDVETVQRQKHDAAVRAERMVAVARAKHAVTLAEKSVVEAKGQGDAKKTQDANKALSTSQENLKKAIATSEADVKPEDNYTRFIGAKWTATRFFSSGRDDPDVKFAKTSTGRRTALARWITDQRNPLTARVAVNHIWNRHMGRPLVPTVFDFGRKGTPPTHPELLDWLAAELIENDWSMKHLHSVIVSSAAYRLSSSIAGREESHSRDPANNSWWRREPIRLESQVVRDSLLSLAGTLDPKRGGPPVPRDRQAASTRRSLYFYHSNNDRNPFLTTFDEASVKDCYRREQSIVPQQALALSNSALTIDASEKIAARLSENRDDEEFMNAAFAVVVGSRATKAELAVAREALTAWQGLPGGSPKKARSRFVWALLNHNDFVTLR